MTCHSNAVVAVIDVHDMISDIFSARLPTNKIMVPKNVLSLDACLICQQP